jgi:hypothetical protein
MPFDGKPDEIAAKLHEGNTGGASGRATTLRVIDGLIDHYRSSLVAAGIVGGPAGLPHPEPASAIRPDLHGSLRIIRTTLASRATTPGNASCKVGYNGRDFTALRASAN